MTRQTAKKVYESPEQRREEIIKCAFLCLSEEGYAKLSARKIAARAEMSLGHISYHFKNMNELLVEAYKYASRKLYEATQAGLVAKPGSTMSQLEIFCAAASPGNSSIAVIFRCASTFGQPPYFTKISPKPNASFTPSTVSACWKSSTKSPTNTKVRLSR